MITLPALLFGFLVSSFLGAAFHVWKGGSLGRLLLYLMLAWVGFWAGHFIGGRLGLTFGSIGPLHFGMAILTTAVTVLFGYWLSLVSREDNHSS